MSQSSPLWGTECQASAPARLGLHPGFPAHAAVGMVWFQGEKLQHWDGSLGSRI